MSTDAADNSQRSNTTGPGGCTPGAGSYTPTAVGQRADAVMSQARRVFPLGPGWAARLALLALLSRPEGRA